MSDHNRLTISDDEESLALDLEGLLLVVSESLSGNGGLSKRDQMAFEHGQVAILDHVRQGINTLRDMAMGNVTKIGGRNDG